MLRDACWQTITFSIMSSMSYQEETCSKSLARKVQKGCGRSSWETWWLGRTCAPASARAGNMHVCVCARNTPECARASARGIKWSLTHRNNNIDQRPMSASGGVSATSDLLPILLALHAWPHSSVFAEVARNARFVHRWGPGSG